MQSDQLKRREFITVVGGAAAWPLAARAQQRDKMRRIGVLMNIAAEDEEGQGRLAAFLQGLQEAGWSVGRNCGFTSAGALVTPNSIGAMPRNWSRSRRMSF